MNIATQNKIHLNTSVINDTTTIYLRGRFTFDAHRDFKATYKKYLANSIIINIVINFANVSYLDSSALGM